MQNVEQGGDVDMVTELFGQPLVSLLHVFVDGDLAELGRAARVVLT